MPVNIDQKASSRIAANAQNLYRPRPKSTEWEVSFLECPGATVDDAEYDVGVDIGSASSSFISPIVPKLNKFNKTKSGNPNLFCFKDYLRILSIIDRAGCEGYISVCSSLSDVDEKGDLERERGRILQIKNGILFCGPPASY